MARLNRVFAIDLSICPRLVAANCEPLPPLPSPPSSQTSSNTCVRLEPGTSSQERRLLVSSPDAANRPVAERCAVYSRISTLRVSLKRASRKHSECLV
jgi:hypothetical protein